MCYTRSMTTLESTNPSAWCPERSAATFVASDLGGHARRTDLGGVQLTHDYDIVRADGTAIALEVTQHAVPQQLALRSEISKRSWKSQHLASDWVVDIEVETQLGDFFEPLISCLGTAESQRIRTLVIPSRVHDRNRHARGALASDLHALGVRMIVRGSHGPAGGTIHLNGVHPVTSYDANSAAEVVREHAIRRSDNRRKLARATSVSERHLFVWVLRDDVEAATALLDGVIPADLPELPLEIDAVWVALACEGRVIWRYNIDGWQDLSCVRT